jgi:hypothetical protein
LRLRLNGDDFSIFPRSGNALAMLARRRQGANLSISRATKGMFVEMGKTKNLPLSCFEGAKT